MYVSKYPGSRIVADTYPMKSNQDHWKATSTTHTHICVYIFIYIYTYIYTRDFNLSQVCDKRDINH